jgi:hypothetical protein
LAVISIFIGLSSGSYLSHAAKKTYRPNVEAGHGFEGRVNTLLAKLLLDTTATNSYSINNLNSHYKSLRFIVPKVDGSELINKNSIRLIGVSPKSEEDNTILEYIKKTQSVTHVGKLNRTELYNLMSTAEYWLYPSYFQETSCITSLELLASEVIETSCSS